MLSREFGGVDLSGGEWQRVAIARGLYRPHDTIILDEPTAAIDPLEEDRVYRIFLDSARGKTAIIVTHRLGLARIADRILVMDRGRLVQDGTHAELMAAGWAVCAYVQGAGSLVSEGRDWRGIVFCVSSKWAGLEPGQKGNRSANSYTSCSVLHSKKLYHLVQ